MITSDDIRAILIATKWNQTQLAERVGVQQPSVSRWLNGATIDFEHQARLAAIIAEYKLTETQLVIPNIANVPLVSWVAAGHWQDSQTVHEWDEVETLQVAGLPNGRWIALRVGGTSMNLIAPPGALIFVNKNENNLISGRDYVVTMDNKSTFKRYFSGPDRFEPYSSDPSHRTLFPQGEVKVVGRVERVQIDY